MDTLENPPNSGTPSESDNIVLGFLAYVRDLPILLKDQHEGHMVAYDGGTRLDIACSDAELHAKLVELPYYSQRMKELFVTRITELDAEELGISL